MTYVCGQVYNLRINSRCVRHDLSSHIQPSVEMYCVIFICVSTNNACNSDSSDSRKMQLRCSYNGNMGTLVVY